MIISGLACFELSLLSRYKIDFPGRDILGPGSPACLGEFPCPGHAPVRGG
jgi:hypothetical protein